MSRFPLMAENWVEREAVCRQCPFLNKDICTKCGCLITLKCKWKKAKCPEGKWGIDGTVK